MEVRTYQGVEDLHAMLDLLSEGRRSGEPAYYIHRGDLQWWLFYTYIPEQTWRSNIRLWVQDGRLIGWTLLSLDESSCFDVFVHPRWRGTFSEEQMLASAVNEMNGLQEIRTVWIAEDDEPRIRWLEANGFQRAEGHYLWMKRNLSGSLDGPPLPAGFTSRHSRGKADARLRSVASAAAFESGKAFDEYVERTARFTRSPIYVP